MANGHGGARPGAGRKKKALSEKLVDGNPGKAPLTKIQFGMQDSGLAGEDMPPIAEYLTQVTKNSNQNLTPQIYADTWKWLNDRLRSPRKGAVEQYALYVSRWIQCEEGINQYGVGKHPTTQMPIAALCFHGLNFEAGQCAVVADIPIVKENSKPRAEALISDDLMNAVGITRRTWSGLIDVDSHNFPNLCLMKLAAYHKAQGDRVGWYDHDAI